jgi:hypothetical protein
VRSHPVLDLGLPPEIHGPAAGIEQQVAGFASQPAHHGASHHAVLTGDPDQLVGKVEEHPRI